MRVCRRHGEAGEGNSCTVGYSLKVFDNRSLELLKHMRENFLTRMKSRQRMVVVVVAVVVKVAAVVEEGVCGDVHGFSYEL